VLINLLFLSLGALLYLYAAHGNIPVPERTDFLFPLIALHHLGGLAAIVFLLGLTAATFSSADSVLTTLTTSFCIDILGLDRRPNISDATWTRLRHAGHLMFAVLLLAAILIFEATASDAVIALVLKIAGYTYGPLLGLFAFGILTRRRIPGYAAPAMAILAPVACAFLEARSSQWLGGYRLGNELLLVNGILTYLGLLAFSLPGECTKAPATSE
jgi:Na+/proline symporter